MDKPPAHRAPPDTPSAHLARNLASLRQVRQLTQESLAGLSGLPRSTIANLESGESNPSLAVLVKVASALQVPIDELLAAPRAKVRHWLARDVGSRQRGRGVVERDLLPEPVPEEMMSVMDFQPGAVMAGTPHLPGTREFFTCLEGRITLHVAGDAFQLAAGDVLAFPGNVRHSYQNPDAERPARGVSVVVFAKAGV
ncbi:cupin domain-containing protein [Aquabacterium sp. A7-Y]|uniref:helix-turn-helix domain-containing protein n=1 Tax=Aquabacterium sp. A7-Y TaxID=1349605 RepID=UPI00223CEB27|nr:helix-turn-helix transcriptional regulator [Aquabacterium sp. A7-Y]MCW7540918.1 cupin domain-containing protein [Aquabacterium sp. A7-Y]